MNRNRKRIRFSLPLQKLCIKQGAREHCVNITIWCCQLIGIDYGKNVLYSRGMRRREVRFIGFFLSSHRVTKALGWIITIFAAVVCLCWKLRPVAVPHKRQHNRLNLQYHVISILFKLSIGVNKAVFRVNCKQRYFCTVYRSKYTIHIISTTLTFFFKFRC